ncbi:MAG TPA: hypothetical protein VMB73_35895 [Acetobacteraceae bacterium]|jgi:flagellar assembly protein FliH|nr:hypothetical protein [Acetobacteraceae bacterium]
MTRRFIPPALTAFGNSSRPEVALELARARDAGFAEGSSAGHAKGYAAGLAEGEAKAREACAAELARLEHRAASQVAVAAVAQALDELSAHHEANLRALDDASREAVVTALHTLFPLLSNTAAGAEIAALTTEALTARAPEMLTLRAAPETLAAVLAEGAADPDTQRLTLIPDASCEPGAAALTWCGGGLTFDPPALLRRIAALLAPAATDSTPLSIEEVP